MWVKLDVTGTPLSHLRWLVALSSIAKSVLAVLLAATVLGFSFNVSKNEFSINWLVRECGAFSIRLTTMFNDTDALGKVSSPSNDKIEFLIGPNKAGFTEK